MTSPRRLRPPPELQPREAVEVQSQPKATPVSDAEEARPQPAPKLPPRGRFQARAREAAGIEPGDILNKNAQPFTVRLHATRAAQQAGSGHEVVPVRGGSA